MATAPEPARRSRLRVVVLTITAAVALALAGVGVTHSSVFRAKTIRVTGAPHLGRVRVLRLAGVGTSTNLFYLSPSAAEARLEASAWVERATVTRRFPSSILITIVERRPVARVGEGGQATLALAREPLQVEYRRGQRELPVSIKLIQFRKIDYPGTTMAAAFEADVELTDPRRGVTLKRKISMNNPLKYGGYTFFQASYIPGTPQTTVLAVRKDPGTPFVYTGFIIVIAGVVGMFIRQARKQRAQEGAKA